MSMSFASAEEAVGFPDAAPARTIGTSSGRLNLHQSMLGLAAACGLGLLGFALVGHGQPAEPLAEIVSEAAPAPAVAPAWVEIVRPIHLYELSAPLFGKLTPVYEARRNQTGGRADVLGYGSFDGGASPWLRLRIYRAGAELPADDAFYVDLARLAAQSGLSLGRSATPGDMATRFGTFEVGDLVVTQGGQGAGCLGFRTAGLGGGVRISGLACGTDERPMERATLSCVLDRLDLVSAGSDLELAAWFAQAEAARGRACPAARTAGARGEWLEPGKALPGLRGTANVAVRRVGR